MRSSQNTTDHIFRFKRFNPFYLLHLVPMPWVHRCVQSARVTHSSPTPQVEIFEKIPESRIRILPRVYTLIGCFHVLITRVIRFVCFAILLPRSSIIYPSSIRLPYWSIIPTFLKLRFADTLCDGSAEITRN